MLQRDPSKKFAPGMWTGIGGKYEGDEEPLAGAARELREETGLTTPLREFARCSVNGGQKILYYFWGELDADTTPTCNEGTLHWIEMHQVLGKDIIPTTRVVLEEWAKRDFAPDKHFTVLLIRNDANDAGSTQQSVVIQEGLHNA